MNAIAAAASTGERAAKRRLEPLLVTWARRAMTIPLYISLATVYVGAAPLWLPIAYLTDTLRGDRRRAPRTRGLLFFALYLVCEVVGVLLSFVVWLPTLGGRVGGRARFIDHNAALQRWWSGRLFWGARRIFGMKVEVEGAEVAAQGPFLLFVRHSSAADTVLAAAFVANPNKLLLRYVLKQELLWDPCLDIVGQRLPNAFIDRKAPRREGEIQAMTALMEGVDNQSAVLIYPEGTRFSPKKLARAREKLNEQGHAALAEIAQGLEAVLPPKLGGPLALLEAAEDMDVVILEHAGFEGAASFSRFWNGALVGQTLNIRLRRIPASEVPKTNRARWLFETWAETDRWVRAHQS